MGVTVYCARVSGLTQRDGTLVRIIQGPYDAGAAGYHAEGWERELGRLQDHLDRKGGGSK